jgi:N-acetylglucosamine-6-phosphate deacetylase
MIASLVTDRTGSMQASVRGLADLVEGGLLAGIHLEGPWLSPRHAGAHDPDLLTDPTPAAVDALLEAGRGHVRMVTLAPELAGGLDAIRRLTTAGVVAAIGHTDATYDIACAALDAGAGVGTHLFNAMRGLHHREPGPIAALLEDPDAYVELVSDGVHVHPAALRLAARAKPGRVVLVTDAMAAAAAADGDYRLGRLTVEVRDGVARLADSGAIAGSTLTMAAAVRYAVQVAGLPLEDVVRAATAAPAALLGLEGVGALAPGHRADLVVLDDDLAVQRVLHGGQWA